MKMIANTFSNMSIKYKLFASYMFVILISFGIFSFMNYVIVGRDVEKQAIYSSGKIVDQTVSFLENRVSSVKNVLNILALDSTVQELVNRPDDYYYENIGNWLVDSQRLTKLFYSTCQNFDILSISIYMTQGLAKLSETDSYFLFERIEKLPWYQQMVLKGELFAWVTPKMLNVARKDIVSLIRLIPDPKNISEYRAALRADISITEIERILNQALFTNRTLAFIVNSNSEVVARSLNGTNLSVKDIIKGIKENILSQEANVVEMEVEGEKLLIRTRNISDTDWYLVLVTPYKEIHELNIKTIKQVFFMIFLIAPFTLIFSFWAATSSTSRIKRLTYNMKKVIEKGDFNIELDSHSQDEVGQLIYTFNYMLKKIKELLHEQYQLGKEKKNLELKALQSQINPHFLYNTLDLINWIAIKNKNEDISRLVTSLSQFYKLSLSKGEDVVTVENEIEHVKAYVMIQNYRFDNCIDLKIDVPQKLLKARIPKLTLQPLVENSIHHGILEKDEQKGTIIIKGEILDDKMAAICVIDDGVGISKEVLEKIKKGEVETSKGHGFGIKNINERLKIYFGNEAGLFYESKINEKTVVKVLFPVEE
ncbi:cache domain-containing sensor histidine kinase [Anaerocellum diazotrophicum]|uniref:Histidine kinase n=1 Tax=Caldicellulosiruptor diazotrophicus TaxID=2806205 RepID=A0ABM7NP64_9FIRM|nr:sensor histidine kinase [Caldicellulosiruptor diazotrophicus]BCS81892.1 histidine kinase [Caldicellulosiruptor diazotrophicus]